MVITELYIRKFGRLSDRHFYLGRGFRSSAGTMSSARTTLHAFIRAMLFGLDRGRGRAAANDDFTRYEPWDEPGVYGGVMRFTCGGRRFRLERDFARYTRRASLVCEDDGEELSVEDGDLEMLLGGLTPGVFDSTVSVGQLKSEPGKELSGALADYAANYYETGGGAYNLSGALQILTGKRRETERELRAETDAEDEVRTDLQREIRYLERDMQRLEAEYKEKKERLGQRTGGEERSTGEARDGETAWKKACILSALPGILLCWPARCWPEPAQCPGSRSRQERRSGRRCCSPGSRFFLREQLFYFARYGRCGVPGALMRSRDLRLCRRRMGRKTGAVWQGSWPISVRSTGTGSCAAGISGSSMKKPEK